MSTTEKLFSYGTLQVEKVQLDTFGRKLQGRPDTLTGYKLDKVKIIDEVVLASSGEKYHPILVFSGDEKDQVSGVIFEITALELQQADIYEAEDYKRILETFKSGAKAWVYISAK